LDKNEGCSSQQKNVIKRCNSDIQGIYSNILINDYGVDVIAH
jgi:hypothetical protein